MNCNYLFISCNNNKQGNKIPQKKYFLNNLKFLKKYKKYNKKSVNKSLLIVAQIFEFICRIRNFVESLYADFLTFRKHIKLMAIPICGTESILYTTYDLNELIFLFIF